MKLFVTRLERLVNNMTKLTNKLLNQAQRKSRIRAKISGTSLRPRLTVTISNTHISAQIIDDSKQSTLVSSTTVGANYSGTITEQAAVIGADIAKKAIKSKIKNVVFDRNGRLYAGRLSAFAEAARKEGLGF